MSEEISIIAWNCRGARSGQFARSIKEMIKSYKPTILIILKSKISGDEADEPFKSIGMKD